MIPRLEVRISSYLQKGLFYMFHHDGSAVGSKCVKMFSLWWHPECGTPSFRGWSQHFHYSFNAGWELFCFACLFPVDLLFGFFTVLSYVVWIMLLSTQTCAGTPTLYPVQVMGLCYYREGETCPVLRSRATTAPMCLLRFTPTLEME